MSLIKAATVNNIIMPQRFTAPVVSQEQVAPNYYRLRFQCNAIACQAKAGQFVHILPRSSRVYDPFLRRAFSILSVQNDTFEILYKAVGRGTSEMALWSSGQIVDMIGPLGQPFSLPSAKQSLENEGRVPTNIPHHIFLVGGGVGVPPLAMLATQRLSNSQSTFQETRALIGARSKNDVLCREDFARAGVPIQVATDDGSEGESGLVTGLLKAHIERLRNTGIKIYVYSCGPLPMLRAVAAICLRESVDCQVSLEENMPCGIGICNGCVVPINGPGDEYGRYRRICVEGPVLHASEIDWSHWEERPCP